MTESSANVDEIAGGAPTRARARWPLAVLVVLLVVALTGRWADGQQRRHEFRALLAKTADAQATVLAAQAGVLSIRSYTMPLLVSSSSATVRSGLAQLIDQSAATGATSVRKARDAIAMLTLLPWHREMQSARRADLAYLDQRIADLDSVAKGGDLVALHSAAATSAASSATSALQRAAPTIADANRAAVVLSDTS
jgi:hypothetical protein